jgi:uncharacterized flavoprotein (TIGR03862 family)
VTDATRRPTAAVVGAGPAGLIAAEILARAGVTVVVHERMPSPGRKFLMAGRGGLNLTHSEPFERFVARYGRAAERLRPALEAFPPEALVRWCEGLGQPTFVGSSGRVFPTTMKASPLLRAWLRRLDELGVEVRLRRRWLGWTDSGALAFDDEAEGRIEARSDATVLAFGGASWPRLGSDGGWRTALERAGAPVVPFRPSNMGVVARWSDVFAERFAGEPLKSILFRFGDRAVRGEAVIARYGLEGGAIYALSAPLREAIERNGSATLVLDLKPDTPLDRLTERLSRPRAGQSTANVLRKAAGLPPAQIGLLREGAPDALVAGPGALAAAVKALPLRLTGVQGLDRAISSAGGLDLDAVGPDYALRARPGVFVAGEMLDWEAPTGGYLLQASFATGVAAARGALSRLGLKEPVATPAAAM